MLNSISDVLVSITQKLIIQSNSPWLSGMYQDLNFDPYLFHAMSLPTTNTNKYYLSFILYILFYIIWLMITEWE
jgi:hypothetical protein